MPEHQRLFNISRFQRKIKHVLKKKTKKTAFRKENGDSRLFPLLKQKRISREKGKAHSTTFIRTGRTFPASNGVGSFTPGTSSNISQVISAGSE
jgi:hypothetical protein